MIIASLSEVRNPFFAAREFFNNLIATLSSEEIKNKKIHKVEEVLVESIFDLGRLLLDSFVKNKGNGDVGELIIREDRVELTHRRERDRKLMSIFGEIEIDRLGYGKRGENSIFPLDGQLALPDIKQSYNVQKHVVRESVLGSYDEAVKTIKRYTAAEICKKKSEEIVVQSSKDFEDFYKHRSSSAEQTEESSEILVLSADGKGIPMRKEGLTEKTREALEKSEQKAKKQGKRKRRKKGEKANRKRIATVGAVYTISPFVRQPCDIVNEFQGVNHEEKVNRPRPENKRVWAGIECDKVDIFSELSQEAIRRNPEGDKKIVFLSDGEKKLKDLAKSEFSGLGEVTIIHDIIHTIEYLWKAAYVFNKEGSIEAEEWVSERLLKLLEGKVSQVAAGIRRSATKRELSETERKPVDITADYLLKYKKPIVTKFSWVVDYQRVI